MTVNTTENRKEYACNGVTTEFSFPIYFLEDEDLVVLRVAVADGTETELTLNTDYTVTGAGDAAGGTVTTSEAYSSGYELVIYRDPAMTQGTDFVENDPLPAEEVEKGLDRATMISQRDRALVRRSLRLPEGDTGFDDADMQLPAKASRASTFLGFDADGKPVARTGTVGGGTAADYDVGTGSDQVPTNADLSVDTISDLRAITPSASHSIRTLGHTDKGDGGGGDWYGVTGASAGTYTDNNGTIIVPTGGDGSAAWLRVYSGAANVLWFGAFPGSGDVLSELQSAVDYCRESGDPLYLPPGEYEISGSLVFAGTGVSVSGAGRFLTTITAQSGAFDVIKWGDATEDSTGYCQKGCLANLRIQGGATSTGGLIVGGKTDDNATWGTASRNNLFVDLEITGIGAGPCVRNSGWVNQYNHVGMWSSDSGFLLGNEAHSTVLYNCYISGHTNEGFNAPSSITALSSTGIAIKDCVIQHCGGTNATIDIKGGSTYSISNLYSENLTGSTPAILAIGGNASCVELEGMRWSSAGTASTTHDIINVNGAKSVSVRNVISAGDCNAVLHIEGSSPTVTTSGIRSVSGTVANGDLFDESTRRLTFSHDEFDAIFPRAKIYALTTEPALSVVDSATDTVSMFFQNKAVYFGTDTTSPSVSVGGSTGSFMADDTSYGVWRADQFRMGSSNARIRYGSGTPEGSVSADVGSIYMRTDGGASTTLYVKESGTGNTGWVAK